MKIFDVVQKCKDAGKLKKSNVNLYRQKVCNKCETLIETLDKNQVKYYNKHVFCDICYEYVQQSLRKNKKIQFCHKCGMLITDSGIEFNNNLYHSWCVKEISPEKHKEKDKANKQGIATRDTLVKIKTRVRNFPNPCNF